MVKRKIAGIETYSVSGDRIIPDACYPRNILELLENLEYGNLRVPLVHRSDEYLRLPFGKKILFEDEIIAQRGRKVLQESLKIIEKWRLSLAEEMKLISPEIQFIRDTTADPEKVVSFSDNSVPGALYVSIRQGERFIDPYDLADSLIHEHRHQKLYILQRLLPLVVQDAPLVPSPWREDLRPPSGLLHAVFVFTHLLEFWLYLAQKGNLVARSKASMQVETIQSRLMQGFATLKEVALTKVGVKLLNQLESVLKDSLGIKV